MSIPPDVAEIRPITLRDQVYREIQGAIIQRRFKPGDRIFEEELTKQMKVSRTPVREALVLLEWDGLVEIRPNRGCYVREFDEHDVRDIFAMRLLLEDRAAELIIDRLTDDDFQYLEELILQQKALAGKEMEATADLSFHEYLVLRSDSPRLWRAWKITAGQYSVAFNYAKLNERWNPMTAESDHRQLLAAYRSRDLERVKSLNQGIIDRVVQLIVENMCASAMET